MSKWTRSGIAAAMFGLAVGILGCTEKEKFEPLKGPEGGRAAAMPNPTQPGGAPEAAKALEETEPFAAGKKVFNASKCSNCHTVEASARSKAPNLSAAGKAHDAAWLAAHVKNPKAHEPMSKMPPFDKLSDAELKAVGEFLASLK